MKTRYIPLILAILLLGSCQEREFFQNENGIRVIAGFADTRTTYTEQEGAMRVDWAAEDEIGLCTTEQQNLSYRAENAGQTTSFYCDGNEALTAEEGDSVFAYYPRREAWTDGTISLPDLTYQYHDTDMADMDYTYASGVVKDQTLSLQFRHKYAFLKITLPIELLGGITKGGLSLKSTEHCAANLYYNMQTRQFTSENQRKEILYEIPDTTLTASEDITCTLAILPQSGNATLTLLSFQSIGGTYEYKNSLLTKKAPEGGFQAGHVYTLNLSGTEAEDIQKTEREALIEFYKATDGDHWKNNTNWCSDKPLDEWYGVRTSVGCVYNLQLNDNSLKGELPEAITKLAHLEILDLSLNSLSGQIPQEIGNRLPSLQMLDLKNNQLTGEIPNSLSNCPLRILDLFGNNLSGEVPDIFNTPDIQEIWLAKNQFTGRLPELGENVRIFRSDGNQFSGPVPDSHDNVLKYNEIYNISYNNLTGTIPQGMVTSDKFHIYWFDILPQNPGYGFEGEVELPAHTNTVRCYDGSYLNLGEEYAKNKYTLLFRWDPYCAFSYEYPARMEQLRKKYEKEGLGIINMTLYNYSEREMEALTKAMPETPVFWETWGEEGYDNNPYNVCQHDFLFVFRYTPYFFLIDQTGKIIFFGSGGVYGDFIPQYHENRDELFDFIANLFGDDEFIPEKTEYYTSSDYSRDGEVITLQEASVGNGIDLVFLGEAFVDKDMGDGGLYEQRMIEGMEQFFAYEPYRSLRNRFNVYAVKVVSPNAEFAQDAEHRINESDAVCFEYAKKIPGFDQKPMVSVIYNSIYAGRSYTVMYSDGTFVAYMMEGVNNVLNHEAGGHGLAKLLDEYVEGGYENLTLPESGREAMDYEWENFGWGANVDWRNDPTTVRWSRFLQDDRYGNEGLGLYEGANLYGFGAYRPTENSMMRYNDSPFNAPSREQIYKTVMQMSEGSSWTYDYEDFVEFDAVSRDAATTRSLQQKPSAAQVEKWKKNHRPPVRVKGTWRDARKNTITVPYR